MVSYTLSFYCSHTAQCRPRQEFRNGAFEAHDQMATMLENPGSSVSLNAPTDVNCSHPDNDSYALLHESHHDQQLRIITQQTANHKFTISNVQLSTSGIYCVYKQCVPEDMEQCCIRIIG